VALVYSLSTILGMLSHLIFVDFVLAAIVWSAYRLIKRRIGLKHVAVAMLSCHAAVVLVAMVLYFVDIRYLGIGGGTPTSLLSGCARALAWALGTPVGDSWVLLTCVVAVLTIGAGLWMLWREKTDWLVFFAGVIVVFPVFLAIVQGSEAVYVRYFIVSIAFLLLLCSFVLASLYYQGLCGKTICALLLVAYLVANGWHVATLFQYGRGRSSEAIRYLREHSETSPATIGADHDFRIGMVLLFCGPEVKGSRKCQFCQRDSWPRQGPEWIICHKESFEPPLPPKTKIVDGAGNEYEFVKTFPAAPLSGLHWFLYHNRSK
jgi:hypothetical protein